MKARWTLSLPQTSRANPVQCCSMGWLRSVGSIKWQVSFEEYRLFYRALLQKRPIILSILLTKATPSVICCDANVCVSLSFVSVCFVRMPLHHAAPHCNTLQHTATYGNTLQHTAIDCDTLQCMMWRCMTQTETTTQTTKNFIPIIKIPEIHINNSTYLHHTMLMNMYTWNIIIEDFDQVYFECVYISCDYGVLRLIGSLKW